MFYDIKERSRRATEITQLNSCTKRHKFQGHKRETLLFGSGIIWS